MDDNLAPILLFVYNRPLHTEQTLKALSNNQLSEKSKLFIFADGAKKNANEEQLKKIAEVRSLIRQKQWCGIVEIIERKENLGIEVSEVTAITEKINEYGKVIVLEDDMVTSQGFLRFMNQSLNVCENKPNVYGVTGYTFPISYPQQKAVLLPFTSVWGWATWKDRWAVYDSEMKYKNLIISNPTIRSRFDIGDSNHAELLNHPDNPWDIRWYYSVFIRNGLYLFPTQPLVSNIGMDGSGTHYTFKSDALLPQLSAEIPKIENLDEMDFSIYNLVIEYFRKENIPLYQKPINLLKKLLHKFI
jgi:hypothetical protein